MGLFYNFHIEKGSYNSQIFVFDEVYDKDCQYSYIRLGSKKSVEVKRLMFRMMIPILRAYPLNSAANIVRNIKDKDENFQKLSVRQLERLCRRILNDCFGKKALEKGYVGMVCGIYWAMKDSSGTKYVEMTQEQIEYFKKLLSQETNEVWDDDLIDVFAIQDNDLTEQEQDLIAGQRLRQCYKRALFNYRDIYDEMPLKIKRFEFGHEFGSIEVEFKPEVEDWLRQEIGDRQEFVLKVRRREND